MTSTPADAHSSLTGCMLAPLLEGGDVAKAVELVPTRLEEFALKIVEQETCDCPRNRKWSFPLLISFRASFGSSASLLRCRRNKGTTFHPQLELLIDN